ncbi:MAG: hypothetical protein MUC43_01345 [Pirellula sp.]|jgi:hypothetical protein|nr:hypothetical protein [Pirellula sp.]
MIDAKRFVEINMETSHGQVNETQPDVLWQKISQLAITPPNLPLTFEARLAREQAWSLDRALAVVEEYRKFLYLLLTCSHPVTPSEEVDAAWHLHLLYTRSYYEDLCQEIAGFVIHHQPTAGGPTEGHKFRNWYQQTLDSYAARFGIPPQDIWPPSDKRFANAGAGHWFNPATHILIPRPGHGFSQWLSEQLGRMLKWRKR